MLWVLLIMLFWKYILGVLAVVVLLGWWCLTTPPRAPQPKPPVDEFDEAIAGYHVSKYPNLLDLREVYRGQA